MARTPIVSVCIPSYNHARFLPAALDSILGQTFRDFELIVVDDGSTDNSLEILQSYVHKYPEIMRVFTHPGRWNLGISATDNRGIKEARGVYWCPQDSDNVSYPDRLERQVAFLESHPDIGWIYGVTDLIDKNGIRFNGQFEYDLSAFPDLVEHLILDNNITPVMVRMKCMTEVGPFEPGLMYGDWEYWIRLAARFPAAFLPGAVGAFRCHDYNTSILPHKPESLERIRQSLRYCLEVFTSLRRKADLAESQLGRPRTKALLDLRRAMFLLLLKDKESASLAAADVFRSDSSFRYDLKHLAHCLYHFTSLPVAFMMIRELGYPPSWLVDRDFMFALLRIGAYRIWHRS
jgi:glycosyltransferase involved in cell wall biosynthesis